jgi:RNA polymerase sigma factor (sigma-70 family)
MMSLKDYQLNAALADYGCDSELDLETQRENFVVLLADETTNRARIDFLDQLRSQPSARFLSIKLASLADFEPELVIIPRDGLAKFVNSIPVDRLSVLVASSDFLTEAYELLIGDAQHSDEQFRDYQQGKDRQLHRRIDEIVLPTDDFVAAAEEDRDALPAADNEYFEEHKADPRDPRWAERFHKCTLQYAKSNRLYCRRFSEDDVAQLATQTAMATVNELYTWKCHVPSSHARWAFSELNRTENGSRRKKHSGDNGATVGIDFLDGPSSPLVEHREDVSSKVERAEIRQAIDQALGNLSEIQLLIVICKQFLNRPYNEISETLSLPISTVRNQYRRAMNKLRESLQSSGV